MGGGVEVNGGKWMIFLMMIESIIMIMDIIRKVIMVIYWLLLFYLRENVITYLYFIIE